MKKLLLGLIVSCLVFTSFAYADHQDNWSEVYTSYSSSHPYFPSRAERITITEPGAKQLRVHFSNFQLEKYYDFVEIYDDYGNLIQRITGSYLTPFWSEPVMGNTLYVILRSDSSRQYYGFDIDQYAYIRDFTPPFPPTPPTPPTPPVPPYPPVPPVPPVPTPYASIVVDGFQEHDANFNSMGLYGRVFGFYPVSGVVRVTAPGYPETLVGVNVAQNSFSTSTIHLPEGVLTTIEIILQASDGRRFLTMGYARSKNPGYRGFTETRQIR